VTSLETADVVYPGGELTPHGWYHLVNDTRPTLRLASFDETITFYLAGPYAPPFHDPSFPEAVAVKSLKGLIPPWQDITQKGATQDGVTHIDSLYDQCEVEMVVECMARDSKSLRTVVRDLIASLDAKKKSELAWFTQELGWWWAPIRWRGGGAPADPLANLGKSRQQLSLRLTADNAFWRSDDDVSVPSAFAEDAMTDSFAYTAGWNQTMMGANWPVRYNPALTGNPVSPNIGYVYADNGKVYWFDGIGSTPPSREVVIGPYKNWSTATDNQVISIVLGSAPQIASPDPSANDIWGRMGRNPDGTWNGYGIRARFQHGRLILSRFNNFTETVMADRRLLLTPTIGDKWTLLCGNEGNPRLFTVRRNQSDVIVHQEVGTNSALGSAYRGHGFGMYAPARVIGGQATPGTVRKISAMDNTTVSQSGFLQCLNIGDQPMYRDYTLFGPGVFRIHDGPDSDEFIEFGPLLDNQVAFLRSDPRSSTPLVLDLTTTPPTPQQLTQVQAALKKRLGSRADTSAYYQQIESRWGIVPPQGPFYSLLNGRFSDASAIPPKPAGRPADPYYIRVDIDDANANSRIISAGTPLRRWPL
jgi:hypothetical protein